jgi:hypothetical protein
VEKVEGGEEVKTPSQRKAAKDHEQARTLLASEAVVVSRATGLSLAFCSKLAINRMLRRMERK